MKMSSSIVARLPKKKNAPPKTSSIRQIKEGETVSGTVRSLTDYGAFVDLGGVDALLHVSDIAWGRVNKPADVLSVGQAVEVKVLKVARRVKSGVFPSD